jgi:hypothetical protein
VTESLPLRIYRVDTPPREETLFDEALPVDLIFVFFAWEVLCHLENLNQLSHSETSPLPRQARLLFDCIIVLGVRIWYSDQLEALLRDQSVLPDALHNPIVRVNLPCKILRRIGQLLLIASRFATISSHQISIDWDQTTHIGETFHYC